MDFLSTGWNRRSLSRRTSTTKLPSQSPEPSASSRPTTSDGFLSPLSASATTSSTSEKSPSRRSSLRGAINRLRSTSSASASSSRSVSQGPDYKIDFSEIHNWRDGFRGYNRLVTTKISPSSEPASTSTEFTKACTKLSKHCEGGAFVHGLPEATFDLALLWCPAGPSNRTDPTAPSWSWTSYDGVVNFPFDHTSCPDLTSRPRADGDNFRSEIRTFQIGPATHGDMKTLHREKKCTALRTEFPAHGSIALGIGVDPSAIKESGTLRFTTPAISAEDFNIKQFHHLGVEVPVCHLLDENKRSCGTVMDSEAALMQECNKGPWEFILLSRTRCVEAGTTGEASPSSPRPRNRSPTSHPAGTPIWDGERFIFDQTVPEYDDSVYKRSNEWCMLNVMLVRSVDLGEGEELYYERVAVGRMHEDVWRRREPEVRQVVLK